MADFAVKTNFKAEDNVSKVFKKMGKSSTLFGDRTSKAFRKASKSGGGFTRKLFSMKSALSGLAVGFVVRAISNTIVKTAELGDEAAKTGRRLGITAEALQELRFAADRQGVSTSIMDSSFTALQKRVGELKTGFGSLFTFLNKTGDRALRDQLVGAKNTKEAFFVLTKAINKIDNPMDKAALASAAFSRAGVDMLKFMEVGVDGIEDLMAASRKYGGIISNVSAAQAEKFIDAQTNMKMALEGVKFVFITQLFPAITKVMQRIADYIATNKDLIKVKIKKFLTGVKEAYDFLEPKIIAVWDAMEALKKTIKDHSTSLKVLLGVLVFYKAALVGIRIAQNLANIATTAAVGLSILKKGVLKAELFGIWLYLAGLKAVTVAQWLWNAAITANPIGLIIIAVVALIAVIVLLVQNWDTVKLALTNFATRAILWLDKVKKAVSDFGESAWNWLKKIGSGIMSFFLDPIKDAINFISKIPIIGTTFNIGAALLDQVVPLKQENVLRGQAPEIVAPNKTEVESRQKINFNGNLNINGAPPGSTVDSETTGAPPINLALAGPNL